MLIDAPRFLSVAVESYSQETIKQNPSLDGRLPIGNGPSHLSYRIG
jgi:hypothetical protein